MPAFTYEVESDPETGNPVVWISSDGSRFIRQPHHPNAVNFEPWASELDALTWAQEHVVVLAREEEAARAREAEQTALIEQAKADSERLRRVEQMLETLLGGTSA